LEAEGLAFGYRSRTVGRGLSVAIEAGGVLALLGPNGSGKTTLLKTLLGLLPPQAGRLSLDGRPLAAYSIPERARLMAYVPQSHVTPFAFTCFEVVLMGRTAHRGLLERPSADDRAVARGMLERLGIGALADRPCTMISGGERQLVLVARALAQEPRFVVFDEPTASLDFGNQGKVMRQMGALADDGLGVLFTTHDPNQALRYARDVVMLREGTVVRRGRAAEAITAESLRALYAAPVVSLTAAGGTAFLPG
jgi:iron complex transport system ATP-binding protein